MPPISNFCWVWTRYVTTSSDINNGPAHSFSVRCWHILLQAVEAYNRKRCVVVASLKTHKMPSVSISQHCAQRCLLNYASWLAFTPRIVSRAGEVFVTQSTSTTRPGGSLPLGSSIPPSRTIHAVWSTLNSRVLDNEAVRAGSLAGMIKTKLRGHWTTGGYYLLGRAEIRESLEASDASVQQFFHFLVPNVKLKHLISIWNGQLVEGIHNWDGLFWRWVGPSPTLPALPAFTPVSCQTPLHRVDHINTSSNLKDKFVRICLLEEHQRLISPN